VSILTFLLFETGHVCSEDLQASLIVLVYPLSHSDQSCLYLFVVSSHHMWQNFLTEANNHEVKVKVKVSMCFN